MSPRKSSRKIRPGTEVSSPLIPQPSQHSGQSLGIPRGEAKPDKEWRFSFQYWRQIDKFGLDCSKVSSRWFVSLLEKFRDFSGSTVEHIFRENSAWRWHAINWSQPNIPIQPSDLDWIPTEFLESEDVEFYQFQLSKSLGRIIGFVGFDYVFHVVLLDPMHNAQPAKDYGYQVDETKILKTEYQALLHRFNDVKSKINQHCPLVPCNVMKLALGVEGLDQFSRYLVIDEEFDQELSHLIREYGYQDVFWLLLDAIEALKQSKAAC